MVVRRKAAGYRSTMALGQNIKFLRQARGWTLEDLSSQSGVDVGTISALEVRRKTANHHDCNALNFGGAVTAVHR